MSPTPRAGDNVVWRHHPSLAEVMTPGRVALASLERLEDPPVLLTDSAAAIWELLDGHRSVNAVVAELVDEFGADAEVIRTDVQAFVADLVARGLVQPVD